MGVSNYKRGFPRELNNMSADQTYCPMCGEKVVTNMQVHFLKCKGSGVELSTGSSSSRDEQLSPKPREKRVQFSWTPYSSMTYSKVTLLSAFQNVEMKLSAKGTHYASDFVSVPEGEYDGQIVLGSSYSYIYPVRKFIVERNNDVIMLELDPKMLETEDDTSSSSSGNTRYYYTSYGDSGHSGYNYDNTGGGGGRGSRQSEGDINVVLNPAYKSESGYDDEVLQPGTTVVFYRTVPHGSTGSRLYATEPYKTTQSSSSNTLPPPPPLDGHSSSDDDDPSLQDEFSEQLSAAGFSPAPVKSKMAQSRPAKPSRATTSTSTTRPRPPSSSSSPVKTTIAGTLTTISSSSSGGSTSARTSGQNKGFTVSQLQSHEGSPSYDELKAQCSSLQQERDQQQANHKRVLALWEGKVKRLENRLKDEGKELPSTTDFDAASQERIAELEAELEEVKRDRDTKEERVMESERELMEVKDRQVAMENQLTEYAGTIQDQTKVIHSYSRQGSTSQAYHQLHEQYESLVTYSKKQQLEYKQAVVTMNDKIASLQESISSHSDVLDLTKKLTEEIDQYRVKVRLLLSEAEMKDAEMEELRVRLERLEQRRGTNRDDSDLELATMREKYQAYREETERLVTETEELKMRLSECQAERDAAVSRHQELLLYQQQQQQALLVQSSEEKEREIASRKHTEYSQLQDRFSELQQVRMKMEKELVTLRSERSDILQQNAALTEASNIEKYTKLKKEHAQLSSQRKQLQALLEEEKEKAHVLQDQNLELQQQLQEATNPEKLAAIQQKMGRYRQERDQARDVLQALQTELEALKQQAGGEELERAKQDVTSLKNKLTRMTAKKDKYKNEGIQVAEMVAVLREELAEKDATIASLHQYIDKEYSEDELTMEDDEQAVLERQLSEASSNQSPLPASPSASFSKLSLQTKSSTLPHKTVPVKESPPLVSSSTGNLAASLSTQSLQVVEVDTMEGAENVHIKPLPRGKLAVDGELEVVVKRKDGSYAKGRLKYVGTPGNTKDTLAGIALDLPRKDSDNDGKFKDGIRHFKCAKGHGIYTPLSNVFAVV